MRVLRLAYYVLQTDRMLLKYIDDAEERGGVLLTESTLVIHLRLSMKLIPHSTSLSTKLFTVHNSASS